jgi:hypothetical protein
MSNVLLVGMNGSEILCMMSYLIIFLNVYVFCSVSDTHILELQRNLPFNEVCIK